MSDVQFDVEIRRWPFVVFRDVTYTSSISPTAKGSKYREVKSQRVRYRQCTGVALTSLKPPYWSTDMVAREACDVTLMLPLHRMQVLLLFMRRGRKLVSGVVIHCETG